MRPTTPLTTRKTVASFSLTCSKPATHWPAALSNVTEVYAGMRPKEKENTAAFLTALDYYPITFFTARLAGELKRDFGKKRRPRRRN